MKILVTGGAGYIGSTVCSALHDAGHVPVILDSLANGCDEFVRDRIFYKGDIADDRLLKRVLNDHPQIDRVIHLAALIIVPESVANPYKYYTENVSKSIVLYNNLMSNNIKRIIFSSSASIYDDVPGFRVIEDSPLNPRSPYAKTKYMMESILQDFCAAYSMQGIALRYFNVIGADPKLRTGLQSRSPSHVLGKLVSVANGELGKFYITGTDWPTRDGSGIRDYIHVWDLARAHVMAVERFDGALAEFGSDFAPINLGCGNGVTVKEFVSAFEKVIGKEVEKVTAPPREGDVAGAFTDTTRAARLLGWKAELTIEDGISDALRWSKARAGVLGY